MKLGKLGLAILLISPCLTGRARAQDAASSAQQSSLAAAARQAREQKKDQPKTTKVWDNDNLPTTPGSVSVVGESGENTPSSEAPAGNDQGQQPAASSEEAKPVPKKDKAAISSDVDGAKQQLQDAKTDLDILQRKLALDQQMYYGKPDYASDKAGAAALKDEQDQIDAKQQQVASLQKKVDELAAELEAAGGDSRNQN